MTIKRPLLLNILFVLLGVVVAALWVLLTGRQAFLSGLARMETAYFIPLLSITAFFVFSRFVRWQFLLRRIEIRVPTRPSFSIYLASLAGTATPAYVGELLRGVFMRRKFGIPVRIITWVLVIERLLDILALGLIGLAAAHTGWLRALMALFILGASALIFSGGILAQKMGIPRNVVSSLREGRVLAPALGMSLAAWLPAALLISLAAASLGLYVGPFNGMSTFSMATLLGGLTLSPAGVGTTGTLAIFQLQGFNLKLADSVVVVSLVRLSSTGVALSVGAIFLLREWLASRQARAKEAALHFDQIAAEYRLQFQDHIWNHLLARKSDLMSASLTKASVDGGKGLDLGCGLGFQCVEMLKRGYSVIGTDLALNLIRYAHKAGAPVANGNALAMPFASGSLEFVYTIGVLHHLPGFKTQKEVCQEVARVLKPDGLFIVHETNPRNPLFRFYMGYIFPILRSIDEGTEWWIEPEVWEKMEGMRLIDLKYFTFMPDFIPQFLMRPFHILERWLESSPLQPFSVHYMAVVQKIAVPVDVEME